jgi:uncharacterized caspase-like protein
MAKSRTMLGVVLGALALLASLTGPARSQKRIALLIGNNAYTYVPRLATAVGDARAVGATLKGLGFAVTVAENQSRQDMSRTLLGFDKAINPGDTAFFFFAGHGFEIHGQNYLLPTDVPSVKENEEELLRDASLPVERIIDRLQARGARVVLLVLDACRDNPFEQSGTRGLRGAGGLAPMTPAEGVFVVYSAGAKQRALDRLGRNDKNPNSVFTRNFTRELATPGLTLVQIAKRTQTDVKALAATVGHEQTPAYYDQIVGDVIINGTAGAAAAPVAAISSAAPGPQIAAWPGLGAQGVQRDSSMNAPADQLIADLDALGEAQSWRELHDHLADVSPRLRDTHWKSLVEQAALGELLPLTAPGGSAVERLATIGRYYPTFPSLADSPRFLDLRTTVGLDAFARCFDATKDGRQCRDDLERFVHVTPVSAALARDAAYLVGTKFNRQASSLFLIPGLDAPGGEALCMDAELESYVIAGFGLPPDYREAKAARTVAERCWESLKTALVANVARENAASYYLQNACPTLIEHNSLTGLREKRCQAVVNP